MAEFRLTRGVSIPQAIGGGAVNATFGTASSGANAFTLTGPISGTTGSHTKFSVTPNGTLGATCIVYPAATNAGSVSPLILTFSAGSSAYQEFTVTRTTDGTSSVSITNSGGLTNLGTPINYSTTTVVPSALPTFSLRSQTTGTVPFAIGHLFEQGAVAANAGSPQIIVSGASASAQVKPMTYWPDGSVRMASIAGTYVSPGANSPATLTLSAGTPSSGSALTTANLQATGISCVFTSDFGNATFSGSAWASPFQWAFGQTEWIGGHRMSSWIYRAPLGTHPHLVAWMEVRLFPGGIVEILPWVENGHLLVANPDLFTGNFQFSINGLTKFNRTCSFYHHTRTVLIDGPHLSYWYGITDPGVQCKHDRAYMMSTKMVPNYGMVGYGTMPAPVNNPSTNFNESDTARPIVPASYVPFHQGPYICGQDGLNELTGFSRENMRVGGYAPNIGLLPLHDATYFATDEFWSYDWVVRGAFSSGRYPIHYRDETNDFRPMLISNHPQLGVHDDNSGISDISNSTFKTPRPLTNPSVNWDHSHCPNIGFFAHIVTGRFYFMEEAQFSAGIAALVSSEFQRAGKVDWEGSGYHYWPDRVTPYATAQGWNGGTGIVPTYPQVRWQAWGFRNVALAYMVTVPTDTAHYTSRKACVEANYEYWFRFMAPDGGHPTGANPQGFMFAPNGTVIKAESAPPTGTYHSSFSQLFGTAVHAWLHEADLNVSANHKEYNRQFAAWRSKQPVGLLGEYGKATEHSYTLPLTYRTAVTPTAYPDWRSVAQAGPWYENWGQQYHDQYAPDWYPHPTNSSINAELQANVADGQPPNLNGIMKSTYWPETTGGNTTGKPGYIHNLLPSISYAVQLGVLGARKSYNRIINAANWPEIYKGFDVPMWVIRPRSGLMPQWLKGKPLNTWFEIPNTCANTTPGVEVNEMSRFSCIEIDTSTAKIISAIAGGHNTSNTNNVTAIELLDDAPTWVTLSPKSVNNTPAAWLAGGTQHYFYDDIGETLNPKPGARHKYTSANYCRPLNKIMFHGARGITTGGGGDRVVDGFNLATNQWDTPGTWPNVPGDGPEGYAQYVDIKTGKIWLMGYFRGGQNDTLLWDPSTGTYTTPLSTNLCGAEVTEYGVSFPGAHDPIGNGVFVMQRGKGFDTLSPAYPWVITYSNGNTGVKHEVTFAASAAWTEVSTLRPEYAGLDYDSHRDKFIYYPGTVRLTDGPATYQDVRTLYEITPNRTNLQSPWTITKIVYGVGSVVPYTTQPEGILNRIKYIPALRGVVLAPFKGANLYFLRTSLFDHEV